MTKYSISGSKLAQATDWSVPMLIMEANRMANEPGKDGCVLVIEDIHETSMGVMPYFYALLEDRRLGTYKLDPKVAIVGTMNDSDEAGFSGIPSPIKDRCSIVNVDFIFEDWYNSHGKYLNYLVASFIKLHPQYIQEDESTNIEQFLTPRSCTYFGSELDLYTPEFILENAMDLASMKMSKTASVAFAKHVEYLNKIDFSGIVKDRKMINISALKPIDAILYAYIINYVVTEADAKYLITLVENNLTEASFVGFLSGELYNKYELREAGKQIPKGINLVIEALINEDNSKLKIPSRSKWYEYIVEFF